MKTSYQIACEIRAFRVTGSGKQGAGGVDSSRFLPRAAAPGSGESDAQQPTRTLL